MEPSSQDPQKELDQAPTEQPVDQTPTPVTTPVTDPTPPPAAPTVNKKSKKTLTLTLVALVFVAFNVLGAWFWLASQPQDTQTTNDTPSNNLQQTKVPEPNTVAYGFNSTQLKEPSDLFWRPAEGGEKQPAASKARIGSSRVHGNQVIVETYGSDQEAPGILYSSNGGKTYTSIFTGKKSATAGGIGDQITGITFAGDGKSVLFGLLPDNTKNTVKRIFFDKPAEVVDVMTSDAAGVFPIAFNVKTNKFIFSEGCYNCDGNGASTSAFAYDTVSKKRTVLIDGANKHLGILANKAATKLLVTTPTVDTAKTDDVDGFYGYYVGAPYTFSIYDLETSKMQDPLGSVGTQAENKYVRGGFMADDALVYYYSDKQLFTFGDPEPVLLYEAGQPIHEVFYASLNTVFASTGTYENFTLNRFDAKTKATKQLLTGDDTSTRIFGITQN